MTEAAAARTELLVEADGGSRGNPGPAGYGAVVRDPRTGAVLAERAGYLGVASNNVAEYSGLIAGLRAAAEIAPHARVEVRMDSRLVVEQMSGRWQIKHADMRRLAAEARAAFPPAQVTYTWVPRAQNSAADALANEAMDHRREVSRDSGGERERGPREPAPDGGATPADPSPGERTYPVPEELPLAPGAPEEAAPGRAPRPSGAALRFDRAEPVTVVLVRHGETVMTAARQYSGSDVAGPPLTAAGRTQAARAADLVHAVGRRRWPDLPDVRRVLASPLVRAQETAAALGRRLGLTVETAPAFAEARFGAWEGLTPTEVEQRWPGMLERWHRDPGTAAPGGESVRDVGERIRAGLAELRDGAARGGSVAVVSHAVAIRAAVGLALDAPPERWAGIRIPAASVTILRWWPDGGTEAVVVGHPSEP